jgi:hypothetical protein
MVFERGVQVVVVVLLSLATVQGVASCGSDTKIKPPDVLDNIGDVFDRIYIEDKAVPAEDKFDVDAIGEGKNMITYAVNRVVTVPTPAVTVQSAPASSSSGRGIEWIINRESHGDPYAENGKYKGIGQLDASYYPRYVGMTWEECRGNYDIQLQAMWGYINSRYGGSVDAAIAHIDSTGWY